MGVSCSKLYSVYVGSIKPKSSSSGIVADSRNPGEHTLVGRSSVISGTEVVEVVAQMLKLLKYTYSASEVSISHKGGPSFDVW